MERGRFQAWRFYHPDLDYREGATAGLSVSAQGRVEMVSEAESVRQAILLLLTTSPGERVMRPDYGCELRRLVFSPNDDTTAGLAMHYVRQALDRWEPRIRILRLDARRADRGADGEGAGDGAADRLMIELEYVLRAAQRAQRITLALNLAGEQG
jgi:hypothetical protein